MPSAMPTLRPILTRFAAFLVVAASLAAAQPGRRQRGQGVNREQMWPAPTAEDWKRPCLIQWQRTWEDAIALSKETKKAILICVNMDGEIASEHYAGIRYREPAKAKLYEPYVTVIASVYRHSPRDYDERGGRIPCPRFGTVTCGEHIAIEPFLYERFFDGTRVAPRHIMVELDGKETYDVYYTWDTDSVFNAIRDGITKRTITSIPIVRGDRTIVERVASRDSRDRDAVESAWSKGDAALRRKLVEAALANVDSAPDGLLRLAVFGFDANLARIARQALAKASSPGAVSVISEALRVPMDARERDALVAALARLGKSSTKARMLAVVHGGTGSDSAGVDVEGWTKGLAGAEYPAPKRWEALETRVERSARKMQVSSDDAATQLEFAEATLDLAANPKSAERLVAAPRGAPRLSSLMYEDAYAAAHKAAELGAKGWRVHAAIAIAAKGLGKLEEAGLRAEAAVGELPVGVKDRSAARVLELFAHSRQRAIRRAVIDRREWPREWLVDLHSTYSVLDKHPLGTEFHVMDHYDFLRWVGATGPAAQCLDAGLARFPESWVLHDRLRGRILSEKGAAGLEPTYEAMLAKKGASPNLEWFAGYASIVGAEFSRRKGRASDALTAYGRAIAHYENGIKTNPMSRASADHYVALALAGRARLALERGDLPRAVDELCASFERKPEAAATLDGLNLSPADTSRGLRARLVEAKETVLLAKLDAALAKLDPELLELPAYERGLPASGRRGRRRR